MIACVYIDPAVAVGGEDRPKSGPWDHRWGPLLTRSGGGLGYRASVDALRRRAKAWWPDWRTFPARFATLPVVPMPVRMWILAAIGHSFAPQARIRSGCLVTGVGLHLGRDTFVNGDCLIDATGSVFIGDEVHIAHRVQILTANHEGGTAERRAGKMVVRPVTVEDGAWIGAGAILLPGSRVGKGSIVAAGAVVADRLEPNGLYGGTPAQFIRALV